MGQLVVKFKEWREKLELSHEKSKHEYSHQEQRSLICSDDDTPLTRDEGATGEIDNSSKEELFKKFEILESVLENQRKFLENHDIKIHEIENVINKVMVEKEKKADDQTQTVSDTIQLNPDVLFDRLVGSTTNGEGDQAESRDLWKMFECHSQILKGHEERLENMENNITKIETIRGFLEQKKGEQEKTLRKKLKECEELMKKRCESYEKLKKEVEEQLQLQQNVQDNLLAGFLVGFVIMVLICMLPRTLLASG